MAIDLDHLKNLHAKDRQIAELRRYTLELNARLLAVDPAAAEAATTPQRTAAGGARPTARPSVVLVDDVDEVAFDIVHDEDALVAADIRDHYLERLPPLKYAVVNRLNPGELFVHPRENHLSVATVGIYSGAMPELVQFSVQATHETGPRIQFHCSLIPALTPVDAVIERLTGIEGSRAWVSTSPAEGPKRVTVWPRMPDVAGEGWQLVLATRVGLGHSINFGWATFSQGLALWDAGDGAARAMRIV